MKITLAAVFLLAAGAFAQTPAQAPNTEAHYKLAPDAIPQEGVPKGQIKGPFTLPSQAYPGTQHTYWVYVPAQYDPATPASLMIYQDGQAFMAPEGDIRAQVVMDNLIYRREIPVMIAVFINPGRRPDQPEPTLSNWGDRDTNRPTEYNTLDDKYARVIVEELMPVLYKDYNISKDPRAPWDRRVEFRRHCRFHGRLAAAGPVQQSAEQRGELHQHSRRKQVSGYHPRQRKEAPAGVSGGRAKRQSRAAARMAPTIRLATGFTRTSGCSKRSRKKATT